MSEMENKAGPKLEAASVAVLDRNEGRHNAAVEKRTYSYVKRLIDLLLSVIALVILCVPLAIIMLMIYLDDPGPVFFSQYRVGRGGKKFKMYKFRSMKTDAPSDLSTAEIENPNEYITRVGKIIRKYSIDELPQLFNVLIGDMSLVGPRPLILKEKDMHDMRNQYDVYSVRPGLTGLAQINGRDLVTTEEKVSWDVKYLKEYGFFSDLKIFLLTIPKILSHADVSEGSKKD